MSAGSGQPAADSVFDVWTAVRALEESKAFTALVPLLEALLEQRTGRAATPARPLPAARIDDSESVVYLLDDLAEVYTTGLINFERALAYNGRAREALAGLETRGLAAVPVSGYFNPRRSLYYYFYPLAPSPTSKKTRPLAADLQEEFFFGRKDLATRFAPAVLDSVRAADLKAAKARLLARQKYLEHKLGITTAMSEAPAPPSTAEDLSLLSRVLERHPTYNTYYRLFVTAQQLWENHRRGDTIDFRVLVQFCQEALARSDAERAPHDRESNHLLLYWLSSAHLATGDLKAGTFYARQFLRELDRADDDERNTARKRRAIMGKAVEDKRRVWETLAVIVAVAGGLASTGMSAAAMGTALSAQGTYTSVQSYMAAQNAVQTATQQALITSGVSQVSSVTVSHAAGHFAEGKSAEELRKLVGGLTPLALKMARYLNKFEQVELYAGLARGYEQLGDPPRALRFLDEALAIIEAQRSTIGSEGQRINFARVKEDLYQQIVRLLVRAGRPEKAFEYVERAKARALLDMLAGDVRLALPTTEETAALAAALRRREEISALLEHTRPSADQVVELAERGTDTRDLAPVAVAGVQTTAIASARLLGDVATITADQAIALSQGEFSIVEYYIADEELYIFVLDGGGLSVVVKPVRREELFQRLVRFRERVAAPTVRGTGAQLASPTGAGGLAAAETDPAEELYDTLVRPVRERLTRKRLYIIPNHWLYYIPFQALRGDGRYVAEEYAVTYAPSATILRLALERGLNRRRQSALVLANADLGDARFNLPAAEEEGAFVARSFAEATLLTGREARADRFLGLAPNFDIIHVATHALFDPADPLSSAILLASGGGVEARVTARDFYRLRLKASLVVLSACESGLSHVVRGDELVGLIRGVMYSGAASIVASLWKVEDRSTALFMKVFYEHLRRLPTDLALQQAQLETMKHYPAPFYWAPFVLSGDYR